MVLSIYLDVARFMPGTDNSEGMLRYFKFNKGFLIENASVFNINVKDGFSSIVFKGSV